MNKKIEIKNFIEETLKSYKVGTRKIINENSHICILPEGENNYNFGIITKGKIRPFIIRINKTNEHDKWKKTQKEFNTLKEIEKLKIAPKAYYLFEAKKENEWTFLIEERIFGKKIGYDNERVRKNIWKILKTIKKLHSYKYKHSWIKSASAKKDYYEYAKLNAESIKSYLNTNKQLVEIYLGKKGFDKLNNISVQINHWIFDNQKSFSGKDIRITHGDVHGNNMILTQKKVVLLDWEFAKPCDPAYDIASLFMNHEINKLQEKFVKKYTQTKSIYQEFKPRFLFYCVTANFADTIYSINACEKYTNTKKDFFKRKYISSFNATQNFAKELLL